jgi:hypothetical protein
MRFLKPANKYNLKSGRFVNDVPIPFAINFKLIERSVGYEQ